MSVKLRISFLRSCDLQLMYIFYMMNLRITTSNFISWIHIIVLVLSLESTIYIHRTYITWSNVLILLVNPATLLICIIILSFWTRYELCMHAWTANSHDGWLFWRSWRFFFSINPENRTWRQRQICNSPKVYLLFYTHQ